MSDNYYEPTAKTARPYPEGTSWDEAWAQRRRAKIAESEIEQLRVRLDRLQITCDSRGKLIEGMESEIEKLLTENRRLQANLNEAREVAKSLYAWMGVADAIEMKQITLRQCPWLEEGGDDE
jgi:hypothetical protein